MSSCASPQPSPSQATDAATTVHNVPFLRLLLLWPLAFLARLWCMTLRLHLPARDLQAIQEHAKSRPAIILFWHNRLFIAAEIRRRFRPKTPICGLVSASRDGAWLAAFLRLCGIQSVRGSSSRRGSIALRELLENLRQGCDAAITPDGPRGPCYTFHNGPILLARHSGAPLILVRARFQRTWRLRSWDGFYIPVPFSRVDLSCAAWPSLDQFLQTQGLPPMTVAAEGGSASEERLQLEAAAQALRAQLLLPEES